MLKTISRRNWLGVAGLLFVAALVAPASPASADTSLPDGRYVALGDSYSSGKGVEPYEGTSGDPDPCYRSFGAYPRLLADQLATAQFEFWACSGAHVWHLSSRTVRQNDPPFDDPADVPPGSPYQSYLDRLGPDVSLVTITIGGHDAGFGDVMFDCIQPSWLGTCDDLNPYVQADLARLPSRLIPLYRAIRAKIHPEARVLVLGYPQLFPDDPGGVCLDGGFINASERRWLNDIATQLNAVIEEATSSVAGIEFVPVRDAFRGHEICGSGEAYLIGASLQHPSNSFHPNYKGQRALADTVQAHLDTVPSPVEPLPPPPPPPPPAVTDEIGLFDPTSGVWSLPRPNGSTRIFYYGIPGDTPLLGDWDCDGIDTVAMYRPSSGFVYLRNRNDFGVADEDFFYGIPDDVPIAGDWDGDGCDTLAIFRPGEGRVYVSNTLGTRPADFSFLYGFRGDRPFAGDFDGDGTDSIGFFTGIGMVVYRNQLGAGSNDFSAYYGHTTHRFVTGDWDGDGDDTPAAYQPDGSVWLWTTWALGTPDQTIALVEGRLPVAGVTVG
ncbi:MAG: hypothetical protein HKO82_08355 [Acidimicrobiia bacterium]|nr:hypothetical protein [Acidimicrobiia bacterium]NNJ47504.1 hypothetical protein [Acidimicrobiia bacterium]NNL13681.1 hypothetical protein [Acidimicrobiia bacterium]